MIISSYDSRTEKTICLYIFPATSGICFCSKSVNIAWKLRMFKRSSIHLIILYYYVVLFETNVWCTLFIYTSKYIFSRDSTVKYSYNLMIFLERSILLDTGLPAGCYKPEFFKISSRHVLRSCLDTEHNSCVG